MHLVVVAHNFRLDYLVGAFFLGELLILQKDFALYLGMYDSRIGTFVPLKAMPLH